MQVEIGRSGDAETPASSMVEYVSEHITALMTLGGIESISSQKYVSGYGSKLHVSIAPFPGAPKEVVDQGVIIKDAIAKIMSIANITRIVQKPSDTDLSEMREAWNRAVKDAKSSRGGSGQDFSEEVRA